MTVVLTATDRRTKLGVLLLDVLLTEEVDFESQVTLYPVEDGTIISDHITEGNKRVRLAGMISTADVVGGFGISSAFGAGGDNSTKLIDVMEALERIHQARELVTVSSGQIIYNDMAFVNLNASRSSDGIGGNWLSIRAELLHVNKVQLQSADVPPPEQVTAPADGRAGETNKPAGRSTPSSATKPGAETTGPAYNARDRSLLKSGENAGVTPQKGAEVLGKMLGF